MTVGTPVSTFFMGKPIFDVMNQMGYNAATLGNHEFDNGHKYIYDFRDIAGFPLVSANPFVDGKLVADAPAVILEAAGLKVGVIGLTTTIYRKDNPGVDFRDAKDVLPELIADMNSRADLIVLLTHQGHSEDKALAAAHPEIDIIVGGHSHTRVPEPVRVGDAYIVQAGSNSEFVGVLDLKVDKANKRVLSVEGSLQPIPVEGLAPDPATAAVVANWEKKVSDVVDVKIGQNAKRVEIEDLRQRIERVMVFHYKTDFAHHNPGGTRAPLPAGDITIRHIYNSLPFANTLAVFQMSKDEIQKIIPNAKFAAEKPLYSLVTNSYMAAHFVRDMKIPPERVQWLDINWRDPVIEYIKKNGNIEVPVAFMVN
jgi:5'-nucleotidase